MWPKFDRLVEWVTGDCIEKEALGSKSAGKEGQTNSLTYNGFFAENTRSDTTKARITNL